MWENLAADVLLLLHFLWIVFLVLGLPWGLYINSPIIRLLHAFGLIFALALQLSHTYCPLTVWEESLRVARQPGFSYRGSFIITYLEKLVYPGWVSLETVTILTALLVALTLASFILRPPRFTTRQGK